MLDEQLKDFNKWVNYISIDDGDGEIIQKRSGAYITTGDNFLWAQIYARVEINGEEHKISISLNPELVADWVKELIRKDRLLLKENDEN